MVQTWDGEKPIEKSCICLVDHFKLESQNKNWNACQTMSDAVNLTVVVLIILVQK